jgi:hypothetical protein
MFAITIFSLISGLTVTETSDEYKNVCLKYSVSVDVHILLSG